MAIVKTAYYVWELASACLDTERTANLTYMVIKNSISKPQQQKVVSL